MSYVNKLTEENYMKYAEKAFEKLAKRMAVAIPKCARNNADVAEHALLEYVAGFSRYFGEEMAEFEDVVFSDRAQALADAYLVFIKVLDTASPTPEMRTTLVSSFITKLVMEQFESFETWGEPIFDYFFTDDADDDDGEEEEEEDEDYMTEDDE